jgi:putative hydrolase of the HAD superfamily
LIEVVFFDAGDTLLCPQPSFPELAARVLRERGHRVDGQAVLRAAREVSAEHFRRAEGRNLTAAGTEVNRAFWTGLYEDLLERLGLQDPGAPRVLVDTFSDPSHYDLFPDALPALDALQERGLRLGVISNFEPWLQGLLERLGVLHRFEVLAISGLVGMEKPDPRIFSWAASRAGARPEACAHVGDQPYFDADPATAAGMRAVLLDRHGRWAGLDGGYLRISTLLELPGVLA